ncbi:MAG: barstar family protein [Oligoflexia bacterium]|nr:barstar family protein [Oligoflexia bacterium]
MRREFFLDANYLHSKDDFYLEMGKLFDLPGYYEHNLDSLWDCFLTYINPEFTLIINNYPGLLRIFRDESTGLDEFFQKIETDIQGPTLLRN